MAEKYGAVPGSPGGGTSDNESGGGYSGAGGGAGAREQDHLLPIANVSRIMKKGLPANAKISKEAKETVQECVSEFISFITGEASDKCQREKRKTVNGDDLLWAMTTLGFEDYIEPLRIYLHRYREMEGERTASAMPKDNSSVNGMPSANGQHMAAASAFAAPFHTSAYHQVMQQQQQLPYMARNPGSAYGQYQILAPPYQMPMGETPPFSSKGDR